jgi:hypothetical protein
VKPWIEWATSMPDRLRVADVFEDPNSSAPLTSDEWFKLELWYRWTFPHRVPPDNPTP